jgi:hypothetical protein
MSCPDSCEYLARKLLGPEPTIMNTNSTQVNEEYMGRNISSMLLSSHSVCLCDDDNDIEMALACSHAYLPSISSIRMKDTVEQHPKHFTVTFENTQQHNHTTDSIDYTLATEKALLLILERIHKQKL